MIGLMGIELCLLFCCLFVFFYKRETAYKMRISDWSSDVCSSDLVVDEKAGVSERHGRVEKSAKRRLYPHIKDEGQADELAEHAIFHGADRVLINAVERHLGHNLAIQLAVHKYGEAFVAQGLQPLQSQFTVHAPITIGPMSDISNSSPPP